MARISTPESELFESGVLARLSQLDAGYGDAPVLMGVDFEARVGEVAFVTGPTSAGKTTLMQVLRLALPPSDGRAAILGHAVEKLRERDRARLKRRIGFVAETPVFVEEWTALENISLPLKLAGVKPRDYADDVRELVEFVGLGSAAEAPVGQLSGAARRRAAIARALAAKPDLILADDPTAGLSPDAGRRIIRLLCEMRRVGAGVVITTQDESLVDPARSVHWRIERGRVTPVREAVAEAYR